MITIRALVGRILNLDPDAIDPRADLFAAGMGSLDMVGLVVGLEEAFGCEFPESDLSRENFATPVSIVGLVQRCRAN